MMGSNSEIYVDLAGQKYRVGSRLGSKYGGSDTSRPDHRGIDILTPNGTPYGLTVDANVKQVVTNVLDMQGRPTKQLETHAYSGNLKIIAVHMQSFTCNSGWQKAGVELSKTNNTGHSTGPHLHWEVHRLVGGRWVVRNPLNYLHLLFNNQSMNADVLAKLKHQLITVEKRNDLKNVDLAEWWSGSGALEHIRDYERNQKRLAELNQRIADLEKTINTFKESEKLVKIFNILNS